MFFDTKIHKNCTGNGMVTMESKKQKSNRRKRSKEGTTKRPMGGGNEQTNRPNIHLSGEDKR